MTRDEAKLEAEKIWEERWGLMARKALKEDSVKEAHDGFVEGYVGAVMGNFNSTPIEAMAFEERVRDEQGRTDKEAEEAQGA